MLRDPVADLADTLELTFPPRVGFAGSQIARGGGHAPAVPLERLHDHPPLDVLESIAQLEPRAMRDEPGRLLKRLEEYGLDIWFSTEGTLGPVDAPGFLDGDLLSARDGTIVAGNDILLPPGVPAGIPVASAASRVISPS